MPTAQTAAVGASVPFVWSYLGTDDQGIATVNTAQWSTDPPQFGSLKYGAILNLDVTIEATAGTIEVNPFYWQAKDPEGRTYSIGMAMDPQPQLQSGSIRAGEKSRGWVSIEAPQGPVTVQLVGVLDSSPVAQWNVG